MKKHLLTLWLVLLATAFSFAQENPKNQYSDSTITAVDQAIDMIGFLQDSLKRMQLVIGEINENMTFSGTRIICKETTDSLSQLFLSGYVSTYYAYYSDSIPVGSYEKFPTVAPYNNAFSLNIAQLSAKFVGQKSRANLTLQFGDIPKSAWSPAFNIIQEANAGIRLMPKLWLDAGFFRTHIGLESIQPRENITSSIAIVTYFEPYFMSGAKLTYQVNPKLYVQANAFNSFSTFVETNNKKALGISGIYEPNETLTLTLNSLYSDNTPLDTNTSFRRLYNNFYMTIRTNRWTIGYEANVGLQQHAILERANKTSIMYSSLLAAKFKLHEKIYPYARIDYFSDPNELLTGPIYNDNHALIGLQIAGATAGIEYKPIKSSYLRLEGRYLQSSNGEQVFYYNNLPSTFRYELIASLGVWF